MNFKKVLVWSAIGLVSLILILVFIFTHMKHQEESAPDSLRFSSGQLSKFLDDEIARYLPIENLDIAFFEDGTIELDAVLKKEDLHALLVKKQPSLQYGLTLLPEQIDTHLSIRLLPAEKTVMLEPISFQVASFDLTSWISQDMVDFLNRKIAQYFNENKIELLSFKVLPDAITMEIQRDFT